MIRFSQIMAFLFLSLSMLNAGVVKDGKGIVVQIKKSQSQKFVQVRLQPVTPDIIRVSATEGKSFSTKPSLIVTNLNVKTPAFTVSEDAQFVSLKTEKLIAKVSLKTGEVSFFDLSGRAILKENAGGGKTFTSIQDGGKPAVAVRQVFESPEDEAFYGLGQHQSDEFNYKGKNEVLYQYNTKVSVPFVLSNKNYGLLWDNYSLTRFGDPRDYAQLSQFKLYDEEGKEGGITATYYNEPDLKKAVVKRTEKTIDYENLETQKNFPADFKFSKAYITWKGSIEPKESGLFRFILYYGGYTKVYIDEKLVVAERWRTAWNPNSYKFAVELTKGKKHSLRIEWKPDGGSYIGLKALSPVAPEIQNKLSLWSEVADMIDYYFVYGKNADEVISGYRTITGKAQIMPKWAMGFWQSRERYKTQEELLTAVQEFRKRRIPLDNIVLDWSYWPEKAWGSHDFDLKRFPDAKKMVDEVHKLNTHIMISVWPKFYSSTDNYKALDAKGWMHRQAVKDSVRDWIGKGYIGSFYDPYSQGARDMFWGQMKEKLYTKGFDAWWMDASEPDILTNASLEYRKKLSNPTTIGTSSRYFNTYALMNAKAIYEGQRKEDPNKRVFLLTRSGFAGLQRYSTATWSGDIGTRWEDMKAQVSAGLNFAMSGIPYWTMDIGGFCVEGRYERATEGSEDQNEWRELNARWHQFGVFCPLYRSHGQFPYRELYNIAPESHDAYQSILYYNKLRYRLMPYIYTMAGMTNTDDYTIMRGLTMDFGADNQVSNISDQFMFGPAMMVCPVTQYKQRTREVYLPATTGWYDFYTGKFISGGMTLKADAPYTRLPIYVKEGAIIPVGPEIQYTDEKKAEVITLFVYAGKDGQFKLYEDEGTNYNYEKGLSATIPFSYNEATQTLTIGERKGTFPGMLEQRTFRVVKVSIQKPVSFNPDAEANQVVQYTGKTVQVKL